MLALCAANATYLAGLETSLDGDACLLGGTGAPLARMIRREQRIAMTLDEHPDILAAVDGALSAGVVVGAAPMVDLMEHAGCDAVLPFKSGPRVWKMAAWQQLRVLAAPHQLTRQLENKLALGDIAGGADARVPDSVTVSLDDALARAAVAGDVALPRVYQPAVGFAGAGTVLLRTGDDVANLVAHPPGGVSVGKLVEYVDGEPVTVNGVVVPAGVHGAGETGEVLVGMVARQLTGIRGLTPTDFGSCGNDWSLPPSREVTHTVRSLAGRVGQELAARGFVGAYGIDAMVPDGGGAPVLIEINPRWTASLALQVELQAAQGIPTLLDAHLAAFAYHPEERAPLDQLLAAYGNDADAECTRDVPACSTMLAYNSTGVDIRIPDTLEPGVWQRHDQGDGTTRIERVRDGWRWSDIRDVDEFVLLPTAPTRVVSHGAFLARVIQPGGAAADSRAHEVHERARSVMDAVVERATTLGS